MQSIHTSIKVFGIGNRDLFILMYEFIINSDTIHTIQSLYILQKQKALAQKENS